MHPLIRRQDVARKKKNETKSTDSVSNPEPQIQDGSVEMVPTPTLAELEENAKSAFLDLNRSAWAWAVANTKIHDSKLYPGADQPNGWAAYMQARWSIGRAQAFNYVRWVHDEIQLLVALEPLQLEDKEGKSTKSRLDSNEQEPPAQPKHRSESKSRAARSSRKRVAGKLNEEDAQELVSLGNMVLINGQYYGKGTPEYKAEMERRAAKKNCKFTPSTEWQEVPEGITLPNGGEYRMDMESGKNTVRWSEPVPSAFEYRATPPAPAPSKSWSTSDHPQPEEQEEQEPEPREPATDEEIVNSFCGWFAEWVDGLQGDDETCTEERVLLPVYIHILTCLFTDLEAQLKDTITKALDFYGDERTAAIIREFFHKRKEDATAKVKEEALRKEEDANIKEVEKELNKAFA
jgi:hypothetical protein